MEVGNTVVVNGKSVKIVGRHAAGKHVQWTLEDGTTAIDLHLNKDVQVTQGWKDYDVKKSDKILPVVDIKRKGAIGEDLHD